MHVLIGFGLIGLALIINSQKSSRHKWIVYVHQSSVIGSPIFRSVEFYTEESLNAFVNVFKDKGQLSVWQVY